MFFGVYSTTMYELMMVMLTSHALRAGVSDIPTHRERAVHLACLTAGVAALVGFYTRCREINVEMVAINVANHPERRTNCPPAQLRRYDHLSQAFNALPGLLWGWALGPVVVALLAWLYQRRLFSRMVVEWRAATARNEALEATDVLAAVGLDPGARTRRVLLKHQMQAYTELVKPLEPYVVVISLFSIPQIVGVTHFCQTQTQAAYRKGANGHTDTALPCEDIAALVLAFRAIALAMVYLRDPQTRAEAFDLPDIWRRLWNQRSGGRGRRGGGVRFEPGELDKVALVGRSTSFGRADTDIKRMGSMASRTLAELDFPAGAAWDEDPDGGAMDPVNSQIPYQRME